MEKLNVVVFGKRDSGKSTLIKKLSESARSVEYNGKKLALDVGYRRIDGKKLYFFGAPSASSAQFVKEALRIGIDCGVVVIDSRSGVTNEDEKLLEEVKALEIPYLVFVNKSDVCELEREFEALTIKGSAKQGEGVAEVVKSVLEIT